MPGKRMAVSFALVTTGNSGERSATKEMNMSILRIAVEAHGFKSRLSIREILAAAYMKKYGKPMPESALCEDVNRWNNGEHHIPYLFDFILGNSCE